MRLWQVPAANITSDAVEYTTATPASGLTLKANYYAVGVGDTVLKYRQDEIWDTIEWLKNEAMAAHDTARFTRPVVGVNGGATFFRATLVTTAYGSKWQKTLVTDTDISSNPITVETSVYFGYTVGTAELEVNGPSQLGTVGMDTAWEEIKQYYIGSAQASA